MALPTSPYLDVNLPLSISETAETQYISAPILRSPCAWIQNQCHVWRNEPYFSNFFTIFCGTVLCAPVFYIM